MLLSISSLSLSAGRSGEKFGSPFNKLSDLLMHKVSSQKIQDPGCGKETIGKHQRGERVGFGGVF